MHAKLHSAGRWAKRIISGVALLLLLLIIASTIAAYLALTGNSLTLLRFAAARVGHLLAGQRTQQLTLDVQLQPSEGRLAATATLVVQSLDGARQRFYFLLNQGLRLRRVQAQGDDRSWHHASVYQIGLLAVIDTGLQVPQDGTVKLAFSYDGVPAAGRFQISSPTLNPQRVLLAPDALWYPNDAQGFFELEATVTLPAGLTLVHNGAKAETFRRGDLQQVRWTSARAVAGFGLAAGDFELSTKEADGVTYRLYLPPDVQLDPERVLDSVREANGILEKRYGPAGLPQLTLLVDRAIDRGFNDGSGLIGLSVHHFRSGDYGFGSMAHEIAHNWWGGTVAPHWLTPGTGGAWIVDGLAEFSSVMASEAHYGAEAGLRRRHEAFFDPERGGSIEQVSVIESAVAEPLYRDAIHRKGAYVALMLHHILGDEASFVGLREFLQRFRFQRATARDLQQVLQDTGGKDLEGFFAHWLRSDHTLDLMLEGKEQSEVTVINGGPAGAPGDLDLWTFSKSASEPARSGVHLADRLAVAEETDHIVLDPLLLWADVQRDNNRYPRVLAAASVAASARGDVAVTHGEDFPWTRAAVAHLASDGKTVHAWDFPRGMTEPPTWFPDGSRILASYSESAGRLPVILTLAADGAQHRIGRGVTPAAAADGTIYAGKQDRIIRFDAAGRESTLVRRRGAVLRQPVPSQDGNRVVYSAARDNSLQLRVVNRDGSDDHLVLSWDRDRTRYCWAADGLHLYVSLGGSWDWQIWQVPLGAGPAVTLAAGAAAIADLALSPDGTQLAFTAVPELSYPGQRHRLYILRLRDQVVRSVETAGMDLGPITWLDADQLLTVATATAAGQHWALPATRSLKRVRVADGSLADWP